MRLDELKGRVKSTDSIDDLEQLLEEHDIISYKMICTRAVEKAQADNCVQAFYKY